MAAVVVLCGLPGSGKSTLAQLFKEQGWAVICQDELGNRKQCEAACWQALAAGRSVVIDRCNHNMDQRRHWVDIARRQQQQYRRGPIQLIALCLELPVAVCMQRATARGSHATLAAEQAPEVIQRFMHEWQKPRSSEGFSQVLTAQTSEEGTALARQLLAQLGPGGPPAASMAAVEPAVPQWMAAGVHGQQANAHLSASAAPFLPGMAWHPPAVQQQPWPSHAPPPTAAVAAWAPELAATPPQQQQPWQQQQRQLSSSRADAADSWRRRPDGDNSSNSSSSSSSLPQYAGQPPPPLPWQDRRAPWGSRQQQQQQLGPQWQQQRQYSAPPGVAAREDGQSGNIVPFPGRHRPPQQDCSSADSGATAATSRHHPRRHPWQQHTFSHAGSRALDARPGSDSSKIILMFDANGTITSHTSMRKSVGLHQARPGIQHLRRLKEHFRIGMFSSASRRTVDTALELLEEAAGPGEGPLFERELVLCRSHTMLAPLAHVEAGGNEWDTVKPLFPFFRKLHRVLLVDDDSYKSLEEERGNLLLMPTWEEDDPSDTMVEHLVDVLLKLGEALADDPDADVRQFTADASAQLQAIAQDVRAARQAVAGAAGAAADAAEPATEAAVEPDAAVGLKAVAGTEAEAAEGIKEAAEIEAAVEPGAAAQLEAVRQPEPVCT